MLATIEEVKTHLAKGIKKVIGLEQNTKEILFVCKDGYTVRMFHDQDCCEYVRMYEDDCVTNKTDIFTDCKWCEIEETIKQDNESLCDSNTWTFYNFKTDKGYDNMRWLGESNGYYSESVDFEIYRN